MDPFFLRNFLPLLLNFTWLISACLSLGCHIFLLSTPQGKQCGEVNASFVSLRSSFKILNEQVVPNTGLAEPQ